MAKTVNAIQKQRTNTAANWAATNPVLLSGQLGIISDTSPRRVKVGDGVTAWNSLPFVAEIPGIVSIEANKILGSNAAGNGYEFKESAAVAQIISLLYNDETDSSEVVSTTAESAALKTFSLVSNPFSKVIVEIIVQSRVEQSANTKCDFTYRIKYGGVTQQTFVDRIIALSTTGVVSGGRNTATFSCVINGEFPSTQDITVTSQNSLSNASTGSNIRAFRVYAVTNASLMRGASGYTPYIQNNYWYINGENTGILALGGINAGSTVTFTEAAVKDTLISGETIGVLLGKIKKWFSSFGSLAWKSNVDYNSTDIINKPNLEEDIATIILTSKSTDIIASSINLISSNIYRLRAKLKWSHAGSGAAPQFSINGSTLGKYSYMQNGVKTSDYTYFASFNGCYLYTTFIDAYIQYDFSGKLCIYGRVDNVGDSGSSDLFQVWSNVTVPVTSLGIHNWAEMSSDSWIKITKL